MRKRTLPNRCDGHVQPLESRRLLSSSPFSQGQNQAQLDGEGLDKGIHSVSVDALYDGGFVAALVQTEGDTSRVFARRYDAGGADLDGAVLVDVQPAADGRDEINSVIATDNIGSAVVAYRDAATDAVLYRRRSGDFAQLRGAELYVYGTDFNERITVKRDGSTIVVDRDGDKRTFDAAAVQFLSVDGSGGGDLIDNNTSLPSTIHGGDGFDTIWGGTGNDSIRGQGGNDSLYGGDGDDLLLGERGDDTLHGGDGADTLTGAFGDDVLIQGEVNDNVIPPGIALRGATLTFTGTDADEQISIWQSGQGVVVWVGGVTTTYRRRGRQAQKA